MNKKHVWVKNTSDLEAPLSTSYLFKYKCSVCGHYCFTDVDMEEGVFQYSCDEVIVMRTLNE